MESVYHIGLLRGSRGIWGNRHKASTVIVQARKNIDYLSPDLWQYHGQHVTTKQSLRDNKQQLLKAINDQYKMEFDHIIID